MTPRLRELVNIGTDPLAPPYVPESVARLAGDGSSVRELFELLSSKNGFYAFESALLVRPLSQPTSPLGILEWNLPSVWKEEYEGGFPDAICFAEDVFGGQFALRGGVVIAVDPETGDAETVAETLEGWADAILMDRDYLTGQPLAHEWQALHGLLVPGHRLVPKVPFVTGGQFHVNNLAPLADVEGMRFRGSIARQIRALPDGCRVIFEAKPNRDS